MIQQYCICNIHVECDGTGSTVGDMLALKRRSLPVVTLVKSIYQTFASTHEHLFVSILSESHGKTWVISVGGGLNWTGPHRLGLEVSVACQKIHAWDARYAVCTITTGGHNVFISAA